MRLSLKKEDIINILDTIQLIFKVCHNIYMVMLVVLSHLKYFWEAVLVPPAGLEGKTSLKKIQ